MAKKEIPNDKELLSRFFKLRPKITIVAMHHLFGWQMTRIHRIRSGWEMKSSEYQAMLKFVRKHELK